MAKEEKRWRVIRRQMCASRCVGPFLWPHELVAERSCTVGHRVCAHACTLHAMNVIVGEFSC